MPSAVLDLEYTHLPEVVSDLERYQQARVLVRVGGCPAAWVRAPVVGGCITRQALLEALYEQAGASFWKKGAAGRLGVDQAPPIGEPPTGAPPTGAPSLTVVICTRDRPVDLRRCLEGLLLMPDDGQELLVVDSASRSAETRAVAAYFPGVRYLRLERPGLDVARNAALREARGDIVAFIDDDALPDPGWLRGHLAALRHPLTLVSTGLTLPLELESPAQEAFEGFNSFSRGFDARTFTRQNTHPLAAGRAGAGVNMALRRDVPRLIGPFDEALDAGTPAHSGGESELFARVLAAGYRIEYTPLALNWHCHRQEWPALRRAIYGYGVGVYAFWTSRVLHGGELSAPVVAAQWFWYDQLPRLVRSLFRRPGAPAWPLAWDELRGCLVGPWAYLRSTRRARKAAR